MSRIELIAPCHFGLEAVLKREITDLGYEIVAVEDGKVTFAGDEAAIARANIFLRTAERVLVKVEKLIGCCKTVWAVLERDKREIVNLFDLDVFKQAVDGEVMKMSRGAKMLPLVLSELEQDPEVIRAQEKPHTIQYSDMDYNCHCNSTKYLEWMLNARRMQDNTKPFRLDINYVKELYLGDEMLTRYAERAQSVQYQQVDKNGVTSCNARITQIEDLSCK